jgi:hypothetical protein
MVTFTYCDDQYNRYSCEEGDFQDIFGPLYAANGCSFRLYLFLSTDEKGPALCVNPQSSTGVLKKDYRSFLVIGLTGNC